MGLLNHYIRTLFTICVVFACVTFFVIAIAYTRETIPPLVISEFDETQYTETIVDLQSGFQPTFRRTALQPQNFGAPSPDGEFHAYTQFENNKLQIFVGRMGDPVEQIAEIAAIRLGNWVVWSSDGRGFYFLQQDDEGYHLRLFNVVTHEIEPVITLNMTSPPSTMNRLNADVLFISGVENLLVNTKTSDMLFLPRDQRIIPIFSAQDPEYIVAIKRDVTSVIAAITSFESIRLEDFSVQEIDVSTLPKPISSNFNSFDLAWRNDHTQFAVTMDRGGVVLINVEEATVEVLDTDMSQKGAWSANEEWLMGIIPRSDSAAFIAYHVPSGREVTLLDDGFSSVAAYSVMWSPVENITLLHNTLRIGRTDQYEIHIVMVDVEQERVLYDGIIAMGNTTSPNLRFFRQWFVLRYPEVFDS